MRVGGDDGGDGGDDDGDGDAAANEGVSLAGTGGRTTMSDIGEKRVMMMMMVVMMMVVMIIMMMTVVVMVMMMVIFSEDQLNPHLYWKNKISCWPGGQSEWQEEEKS